MVLSLMEPVFHLPWLAATWLTKGAAVPLSIRTHNRLTARLTADTLSFRTHRTPPLTTAKSDSCRTETGDTRSSMTTMHMEGFKMVLVTFA
jgi:hypothetical protein